MKTNSKTSPAPSRSVRDRIKTTTLRPKTIPKPALKTILAPTDFSPESRKAIRYAASLAKALGGKVVLLHVVEPIPYGGTIDEVPLLFTSNEMVKASLARLKVLSREEGMEPELLKKVHVRTGPAFPEIVEEAKAVNADMIVIATHGYNAFTRVIFGSTTERVVRHAKCPVLVVREQETDFVKT